MIVLKRGNLRKQVCVIECPNCHSILQAEPQDDLQPAGSQYNDMYYKFYCPVCMSTQWICETDIERKWIGVDVND